MIRHRSEVRRRFSAWANFLKNAATGSGIRTGFVSCLHVPFLKKKAIEAHTTESGVRTTTRSLPGRAQSKSQPAVHG